MDTERVDSHELSEWALWQVKAALETGSIPLKNGQSVPLRESTLAKLAQWMASFQARHKKLTSIPEDFRPQETGE